jgi:pimeloyl-ACP methyl ester carboxylesterase
MPTITTTDGTTIHYLDWGDGPPVVLSHGWVISAGMWEYQMTALAAAGLRVIAFDRRGCGRSGDPGRGYDPDTNADDLAQLLAQLDLTDVTLVAHSMGAGEAARYLTRHGDSRIARLALVSPVTPFLLQTPDNPMGAPAEFFEAMYAALVDDRPTYLADNVDPFFGRHVGLEVSDAVVQWALDLIMAASPLATVQMQREYNATDFRPDVTAIAVPTLVIHGDCDAGAPLDLTGRRTAELIPGSELRVYEQGPHGLFFTHRHRLNQDLLEFVKG